jgi:hypothetical protein
MGLTFHFIQEINKIFMKKQIMMTSIWYICEKQCRKKINQKSTNMPTQFQKHVYRKNLTQELKKKQDFPESHG